MYLRVCMLGCVCCLTDCRVKPPVLVLGPLYGDIRPVGSALTILKLIGDFVESIITAICREASKDVRINKMKQN